MSRWIILAVTWILALAGCGGAEPHRPFQIPEWTRMPSDDEIVTAVVGVGGSSWERTEAELITRELLLPGRPRDLEELKAWLGYFKSGYEDQVGEPDAFARLVVLEEVRTILHDARPLAVAHVHHDLWPTESFTLVWGSDYEDWIEASRLSTAERYIAAQFLGGRLARLESWFGSRLPDVLARRLPSVFDWRVPNWFVRYLPRLLASRVPAVVDIDDHDRVYWNRRATDVEATRNMIHIALTGDRRLTPREIWSVLIARGVRSERLSDGSCVD